MSFQYSDGVNLDAVRADDEHEKQRHEKRQTRMVSSIVWILTAVLAIIIIAFVMVYVWSRG